MTRVRVQTFEETGATGEVWIRDTTSVAGGAYGAAPAGSVSIGGAVTGGTVGSVLFIGAGGVLAQDNANLFFDNANNRLGVGTAAPSSRLDVDNLTSVDPALVVRDNGTAVFSVLDPGSTPTATGVVEIVPGAVTTSGAYGLHMAFTVPSSAFTEHGARFDVTGAGTGTGGKNGLTVAFNAGAASSGPTIGFQVWNQNAGTGANLQLGTGFTNPSGNSGLNAFAVSTTTGTNVGAYNEASGGDLNVAVVGKATTLKNGASNVGAILVGRNDGTTPISVGVFAGLGNSTPTLASAAMIADNSDIVAPSFIARDNGTDVLRIEDGGNVDFIQHQALQFRIENRTSDPGAPAVGEIWLRTDL